MRRAKRQLKEAKNRQKLIVPSMGAPYLDALKALHVRQWMRLNMAYAWRTLA
jgi:hypothetical protein